MDYRHFWLQTKLTKRTLPQAALPSSNERVRARARERERACVRERNCDRALVVCMGGIVSRIGRAMFRGLVRLCCYAPSPKSTLESRGPGPYLRQQRRSSICLDQQQQQQPTRCCKYQIPKCVNDPSSLCFCDLRDETHICTVQGYYMLLLISLMMIGFPPAAVAAVAGIISYVPSKKGIDDSWQWWCRLVEGQQAIIEDCEVHFSTSVVARWRLVLPSLSLSLSALETVIRKP